MMKKLYLAILTFIMMIFVATTVTYAWLSMSTSNVIRDLSLTTHLGDALEISLDGENYYESLPSDVLISHIGRVNLTDITSLNGKDFDFGIRQQEGQARANKDYISVTFHFRTKSLRAHEVYLSNNISNTTTHDAPQNGTFIVSRGRNWVSDINFLYGPNGEMIELGDVNTYYLSHSMRVSFIEQALNEHDERTDLSSKIFDLSGNEARGYGKDYGAVDYYRRKRGTLPLPTETPPTIYELSKFSAESPYALDRNSHIMTLIESDDTDENGMMYYKGIVTMNIWVEGWDADLFDAVFGDQVKMQFEFKAVHGLLN
ncbi:hypothetical protein [Acholeplasma laidlawii]|uniref:hypothetical protein n=1 Tax=Acholeplasma laidlawii TaxID=2148 RepID=UPI0021F717F1|nr:hypothetical protein [Acholeplasma laidlawii]